MLRSEILAGGGERHGLVAWDERRGAPIAYDIGNRRYNEGPGRLAISGEFVVDTREGPIHCRPAFELFAAKCHAMPLEDAARRPVSCARAEARLFGCRLSRTGV